MKNNPDLHQRSKKNKNKVVINSFTYLNRHRREVRILNIKSVIYDKIYLLNQTINEAEKIKNTNPFQLFIKTQMIKGLTNQIKFFSASLEELKSIPARVDLPEPTKN